jgi:hypothetical protein
MKEWELINYKLEKMLEKYDLRLSKSPPNSIQHFYWMGAIATTKEIQKWLLEQNEKYYEN